MGIYALASLKGGVTKTTTSLMLATSLQGNNLLIDMDHNNNATDASLRNIDPYEITERNVYHMLTGKLRVENVIYHSTFGKGFDVIPAAPILSRINLECAGDPGVLLRFGTMIRKLQYDNIIIDVHPALVLELKASFFAADAVICPVPMSRWELQGFDLLLNEIQSVSDAIGKCPTIHALPAMTSPTERETIREVIEGVPFTKTSIPKSASLKAIQNTATAPKVGSLAAQVFMELAREIESWR